MIGWTPQAFWAATPGELGAAIEGFTEFHGGEETVEPMNRAGLDDLMRRYPDRARAEQ